ncbi:MAG: HAMP domain-containing histidine kinase [Myxococcota bacterium]|nr:HAMP domain-containing histidine kinase [Myxococcota bacterium]
MDRHDSRHSKEREDTDARLLAERAKTDDELEKSRRSLKEDENRVVEVARERAEETLVAARRLADRDLLTEGPDTGRDDEVARQRAVADKALAEERAAADDRLRVEREQHARALSALLALERDATDDGLQLERARADEIVATRDEFLGMVSHDLRNILGNIAMGAATLANSASAGGLSHPATIAITERIQRGTARMNRLVGDLLDVVALEAGALHINRRPHDAGETGKEAVEAYQASFAAQGIALQAETPARSIVAEFDHDRILQVLANLLSNALKFTKRGGAVTLSLVASGPDVQFAVTDTGVGIPADQATAIFERFGQVRRDRRGHGLGLYISKCIVEAHGGKIWADSSRAGGATLRFTLPSESAPA